MSAHVFICYAREDQAFVLKLGESLKGRGVPVWLDQWDIPPGTDWNRSIDNAIDDCAKFLVVLSQDAVDSKEVQGELRTALDENKPIIPVIHRSCRVPRQLRTIQYIDFTSRGPDDEVAQRQLLRTLATSTDEGVAQPIEATGRTIGDGVPTKAQATDVKLPQPVASLREAIIRPIVAFLLKHYLVRLLVGGLGAMFFTLGAVVAPLWSVPLQPWLYGFQVAAPLLAGGLGAIYLWHLSGQSSRSITTDVASDSESHKWPSAGSFGRFDAILRVVIGLIGAVLVVAGALGWVFQNVDGLDWTKLAIAPCFSGGFSALGIWYLSGKTNN